MIAEFDENGAIIIIPENNSEIYALKYWEYKNPQKLIDGKSYTSTGQIIIKMTGLKKQESQCSQ